MRFEISIGTHNHTEMADITGEIEHLVAKSGIMEGICNVYVPHATAAIAINENADPNVCEDILNALGQMIPEGKWKHDRIDNNAAAHIKASIIGPSETIPVKEGRLMLGTWQAVMLCDFDGPRNRKVIVTVMAQ